MTAVGYLIEHLKETYHLTEETLYEFKQAKEIEKQQKIAFANSYGFDICGYDYDNAEQYYNETFKN